MTDEINNLGKNVLRIERESESVVLVEEDESMESIAGKMGISPEGVENVPDEHPLQIAMDDLVSKIAEDIRKKGYDIIRMVEQDPPIDYFIKDGLIPDKDMYTRKELKEFCAYTCRAVNDKYMQLILSLGHIKARGMWKNDGREDVE